MPPAPHTTPPHVDEVHAQLSAWFDGAERDLPWRRPGTTPWGVLVSEVMSQQTPVARVAPRWERWMTMWPTPAHMAAASRDVVLTEWGTLGYPRRALRLHECARVITERHHGEVPATEEELRALPGIGSYTAAAIVAFAFHRRAVVLDTNVRRVIARVFAGVALPPPSPRRHEWELADALAPLADQDAARWAVASMEFGSLVCTARTPRCEQCPIAHLCGWREAGYPDDEHAPIRRPQRFAGTNRQVRGIIMAHLRAHRCASRDEVAGLWVADPEQLSACVESLVADGLVEETAGVFHLPDVVVATGGVGAR